MPADPSKPLTYHLRGCAVRDVSPLRDLSPASQLPDSLIMPPGTYSVHGETYDATEEGLYRFLYPLHADEQRVVYQDDLFALMSGVGWLHSHGSRDNFKDFDELTRIALTGKLILTCGPFSDFVVRLFGQLGLPIRVVCVKTLLEPNGYNDGHVLTEVQLEGRWVVFDPDPSVMYTHEDRRLSLLELIPHVQADDYAAEPLTKATPFALTDFRNREGTYDFGLWYETLLADPARGRREGLRRVMMIPVIPDAGEYYYTVYAEADRQRAEQLWPGMRYLPRDEFRSRFYPEPGG